MASGVTIRRFEWTDVDHITHIFNDINGLTNSEKEYDSAFMRDFLSQPSCDPEDHCFVAELNGSLPGFVLIAYEEPISRAVASGGVLEAYRKQGIGRRLLKQAIDHIISLNVSVMHVEISSQGGAAIKLLKSEGFKQIKCYWQMQWKGADIPEPVLPEGFHLRPFKAGQDEETLTDLQNTAFGENWGFSPNTIEQIHARVRLDRVKADGIILAIDGERPAAYNWTMMSSNDETSTGFISMTGVHPDYRGKRLGQAIVVAGMRYLKSQGADAIELEVDSDNAPARELYLKLGFRKIQETLWYERTF